ncbi:eCIS core domain-containing protein [Streptomyces tanashiensis]|uniref:eCIS core domain-containing protein n=1 Tax=Streptomyces tanashiensis TaxID=67367 RepID=UPI0033FEA888
MRSQDGAGKTSAENELAPARTPADARDAPPTGLLALQGTIGNAAVVQMLRSAGHRPALDQHSHGNGCGHQSATRPTVQRSAVPDVLRATGRPLDDATRTEMETRLGADFSDVRIHNDSAAKASAAAVGARAYTSGNHVVIGDGGGDKHTLAHELTHVIQQRQGPVAGTDNGAGLKVSDPSDRFEREAEANATRALSRTATAAAAHSPGSDATSLSGSGTQAAAAQVQRVVRAGGQSYNDVASLLQAAQDSGFNTTNFAAGTWLHTLLTSMIESEINYTFAQGNASDALLWVAMHSVVEDLYRHLSHHIDRQDAEEAGTPPPAQEPGALAVGGTNEWSFTPKLRILRREQARFAAVGITSTGSEEESQRRDFTILGRTYSVGRQGTNHYYVFPPNGGMHTYAGGDDGLRRNTALPIVEALIQSNNTEEAPAGQQISVRDLDEFVFAFLAEPTRWNPEHIFNVLALERQPNPPLPGGSPRITGGAATIPLPMAAGGTFNPDTGPGNLGVLADRVPDRAITMIRRLGLDGGLTTLLGRPNITRERLTRFMGRGLGILE